MRVQVRWKDLNEGDFEPVVCLDVQHVDLVSGDWEAAVILNCVNQALMEMKEITLGTAQVMLISSVTLFSSLVSPDWWKRNLVKIVDGNGVCKTVVKFPDPLSSQSGNLTAFGQDCRI